MKKRFFLVIFAMALFGLAAWYYFYTQPITIAWHEPPLPAGMQQQSVQVLAGGQKKVTTYLIKSNPPRATLFQYFDGLIDDDWDKKYLSRGKESDVYIDRSRNINLLFFHYWNECPAYYLNSTYEEVGPDQLLLTLTQEAGPCGSPYK